MNELRKFASTTVLESYGYVLWCQNYDAPKGKDILIGFMRRPQPEIHHGEAFPWVMATVGGMRDPMMVLDADSGPNVEGFMGRPPTGDEVAQAQLRMKLGVDMTETGDSSLEGWLAITHPFYYGNKTPDVRNVGTVYRKLRRINLDEPFYNGEIGFSENTEIHTLMHTLEKRNALSKPEHRHELFFMTQKNFESYVLGGNHSLKSGEVALVKKLYVNLRNIDYEATIRATFKPLPEYI